MVFLFWNLKIDYPGKLQIYSESKTALALTAVKYLQKNSQNAFNLQKIWVKKIWDGAVADLADYQKQQK